MKVYFLTTNEFKIAEVQDYVTRRDVRARQGIELSIVRQDLQEILDPDIGKIVREKAVGAYASMRLRFAPLCGLRRRGEKRSLMNGKYE